MVQMCELTKSTLGFPSKSRRGIAVILTVTMPVMKERDSGVCQCDVTMSLSLSLRAKSEKRIVTLRVMISHNRILSCFRMVSLEKGGGLVSLPKLGHYLRRN